MSAVAADPRGKERARGLPGSDLLPTQLAMGGPLDQGGIDDIEPFVRVCAKRALDSKGAILMHQHQVDHLVSFLLGEMGKIEASYDPTKIKGGFKVYAAWVLYKRVWQWYRDEAWEVGIYASDDSGSPVVREMPMSSYYQTDENGATTSYADSVADHRDHYAQVDDDLSESKMAKACAKLSEEAAWTLTNLMVPFSEDKKLNSKTALQRKHNLTKTEFQRLWRRTKAEIARAAEIL